MNIIYALVVFASPTLVGDEPIFVDPRPISVVAWEYAVTNRKNTNE